MVLRGVSVAVSVAVARIVSVSHLRALLLLEPRSRRILWVPLCLLCRLPPGGCLGRVRLAVLLVAPPWPRCLVFRLVVCRGLFSRAALWRVLPMVRRPLGVPVVLWAARLFVAVCVGSARLLAICWYWLLLCPLLRGRVRL